MFKKTLIISSVCVFLFVLLLAVYGQEGVIGSTGRVSTDQAILSTSDWYTMKPFKASAQSGTIYTVSSSLPGYLVKGLYNNRRDSSVMIKAITSMGDTVNISVPTETILGKLPILSKFILASCTDSAYLLCQKR